MCLLFYLQIIKLKIETLFLVFLVLHRINVLNIVSSIALFSALILISHECKGLSKSARILIVFECEVFQWNHIVLNVFICTTGRATLVDFSDDKCA